MPSIRLHKRTMVVVLKSESPEEENDRSLKTLARALELSKGEFSLIIVCCTFRERQEEIKQKLQESYSVSSEELTIEKTAVTLLSTLVAKLEKKEPEALFVSGLESVENLEELLTAANIVRNQFREKLPFPLILWVTEEVQQKLMRLAPDFYSWAAVTIKFRFKRSPVSSQQNNRQDACSTRQDANRQDACSTSDGEEEKLVG